MSEGKVYKTVGYVSSIKVCFDHVDELEVGFEPAGLYSFEMESYASCLLVDTQDFKTDVSGLDKKDSSDAKVLRFKKGKSIMMKVKKRLLLVHLLLTAKVNHTKVKMYVVVPDNWDNNDKEKFLTVSSVELI